MFSSTLAKKVQLSFLSTVGRVKTELKFKSFPPTPNVTPWGEKKKKKSQLEALLHLTNSLSWYVKVVNCYPQRK